MKAGVKQADAASWCLAACLMAIILVTAAEGDGDHGYFESWASDGEEEAGMRMRNQLPPDRPCEEIYVVSEGETLHTISDKCGDPFIVERNPHVHDPDDVFPGLVLEITPYYQKSSTRKFLMR